MRRFIGSPTFRSDPGGRVYTDGLCAQGWKAVGTFRPQHRRHCTEAHIKFLISNMIFSTKLTSGEPGQATGLGGPNGWKPCRYPPLNEARSIAARLLGAAY
jgi:hypothetical protein